MMDYESLIERLKVHDGIFCSIPTGKNLIAEVTTALSMLQVENEKLRAELEQVKRERDAAVKDLNEFLSMYKLCPIQCEWCKWNGTFCDGKMPEWRGP